MKEIHCKQDGFPMVNMVGRWECVAEYLHDCLELHTIVDGVQESQTSYFVFDDGHAIPLLCFCCDQPLAVADLEKERLTIGRAFPEIAEILQHQRRAFQVRLS